LGIKITATVSWFGPWSVGCATKSTEEVGTGHTSRSSSLLGVEASLARVFQSAMKIGGGAMTGGARGTITEVASEAS
jgi:hypothetical protein